LEKIQAELATLGAPEGDTPEERARRVKLIMQGLQVGPPMSAEVDESLQTSLKRPMSMFTLNKE
jgi:hypothetical protein